MNRIYLLIISLLVALSTQAQVFWEEINTPDTDWGELNSVLALNGSNILLGTLGYEETATGLYSTNDGGLTWYWHDLTENNYGASVLCVYNNWIYVYVDNTFFKRKVGTNDWTIISSGQVAGEIAFVNDDILFKGVFEGVQKSTNGGYTWEMNYATGNNESVKTIIQHPNGDLFFGTYSVDVNAVPGVYRSTDLGETWIKVGLNYHMPMALATDSEGNLYAGSWGHWHSGVGGVYKSTDLGVSWDTLKLGIGVRSIVITPGDTIFVGHRGGVTRSTDGGSSWEHINSGFLYNDIGNIRSGGDNHLYASTNYGKLYRSRVPVTNVGNENITIRFDVSVYPNPVSTQLHIRTARPGNQMRITVMNLQGQMELQQTLALPSSINVEALPKGIYILHMQNQTKSFTRKFIKN